MSESFVSHLTRKLLVIIVSHLTVTGKYIFAFVSIVHKSDFAMVVSREDEQERPSKGSPRAGRWGGRLCVMWPSINS
jgi:hypothetical protein